MALDWLKIPETKDIKDLDHPSTTVLHGKILRSKPFMKKLYTDFYRQFSIAVEPTQNKTLVELGSGGGFIKEVIPEVVTSDVIDVAGSPRPSGAGVDRVFSATDMPFDDASVDAFFMLNVLHHIAEPRRFFGEAGRCLKPAGKIVMIEPANTPWASFVYRNFHHENFDKQAGWGLDKQGPLSQGNDAMPWIIFVRDRKVFEREFPRLKIASIRNHTPFLYLLSGGFTLRQLVPGFLYPVVKTIEYILSPVNNLLGMFMTVIIEKQTDT